MSAPGLEVSASVSGGRGWKRHGAGLISLLASGALLVALYRTLDVRLVARAIVQSDLPWLALALGMIIPITLLRALRFYLVAPPGAMPGPWEAVRLTLVASAVNVFLPIKGGDFVKSYFVARRSDTRAGVSISIVVYERLCDMGSVIAWCLVGWAIGRPQVPALLLPFWAGLAVLGSLCVLLIISEPVAALLPVLLTRLFPRRAAIRDLASGWPELLRLMRGRRRRVIPLSLFVWFLQLTQMWMFTQALTMRVPATVAMSLSALALMAGQLPFTFAGFGARDVALVVLLGPYAPVESAAALGVLASTRNLLPPLAGLPLMGGYVASALAHVRARDGEAAGAA